ncbi:glycosyltransferase family 4 protein [Pseudomonas sp. Hp2]|uniref:glycosyltransferase family 4 protein n=1 Tax=Pseudomonas sp. Hp2 TaxID=701189 RepID=UPI00112DC1D2|nr:glycosyltransferase family 4 protein [Pseudomonas sp. Hp2]
MQHASILFVDQSGEMGGAELSLFDIARHHARDSKVILLSDGLFREQLRAVGVDVEVLALGLAGRVERDSRLSNALSAIPSLLKNALGLARRAHSHDLLYANTQKAFVVAALASAIARKPLVWHLRDILTAAHFSPGLRRLVVALANRFATCVIANSQATADAFRFAGGNCAVHVVHNGIDPAPFDAIDRDGARQALRRELRSGSAPLVGAFSRLAEWKGQHVLVEAMRDLPEVHAVFVGGALFGEDAYEARLKRLAMDLGVSERCHFLGFRRDIPALMVGVDIVLHTSITPEPFGRVVVEGMLSGKPVIATEGGGINEIIDDGNTGLLVPPGDPQALHAAVRQLLDVRDRAMVLAERGRVEAHRKFSLRACLAGVDAVIAGVMRAPRAMP